MHHFATAAQNLREVHEFLARPEVTAAVAEARSVLVQIYPARADLKWIAEVEAAVRTACPAALCAGASTVGEICQGRAHVNSTVLSLSAFERATLRGLAREVSPGQEELVGRELASALAPDARGVLLLSTPLSIHCEGLLKGVSAAAPGLPVFGGGAGDYADMAQTCVFLDDQRLTSGAVAVALCGEDLEVMRRVYLGWQPFGPAMEITGTDGRALQTLDGRPAFDFYSRYLGLAADDQFFLNSLEFPLLLEREGEWLARVPVSADAAGQVHFIADLVPGEVVRFGYGHVDRILEECRHACQEFAEFAPEGLWVYSCGCRRFLLQQAVDAELAPLQELAPSAGFFTYGEFCGRADSSPLYNSALVLAGVREGPPRPRVRPQAPAEEAPLDPYAGKHARILSRFLTFMAGITAELQAANAAKSEFLASVSHELRTPLNSIVGYSKVLRRDATLAPRHQEMIGTIHESAEHLLDILNEVLDLARVEAGRVDLEETVFAWEELLDSIARTFRVRCQEKGLEYVQQLGTDLPPAVRTDLKRLRQILLNLVANAIKFTDAGRVELSIDYRAPRTRFAVSDTGVGIKAEDQQRLFTAFEQVGEPGRRAGGSGLGLAITRKLVALLGGELAVESQLGRGSRFWFELELEAAKPAEHAGCPSPPEPPPRPDLERLLQLAREGDLVGLRAELARLEPAHPDFCQQVRAYEHQFQPLRRWLGELLS